MIAVWSHKRLLNLVVIVALVGTSLGRADECRSDGAACRIFNNLPSGTANVGSGTLIDVTSDRRSGLVLTCAHLFSEGTGRLLVAFPDGSRHGALVVAIDRQADLAALEIASPRGAPATVGVEIEPSAELTACGFGGTGEYRRVSGRVIGQAQGAGQSSVRIAGAVRSGDSGGGAFDRQGRLVGVVWGECDGVTYASTGGPLRQFLDRVLARRDGTRSAPQSAPAAACPDGRCPLTAPKIADGAPSGQTPRCDCGCDENMAALGRKLDALEQSKRDRGEYLQREDLGSYARRDEVSSLEEQNLQRHQSLLDRVSQLPAALGVGQTLGGATLTALGISGPTGWAILAAASVGSWLIGRRMKRKRQVAARSSKLANSSQEATAAAAGAFLDAQASIDERQPIERDDREARELLRLSQLEGRDPLQDALAGRIALDRLDAAAESHADPQQARWADDLRRQLRERFNEIAPTKFQIN